MQAVVVGGGVAGGSVEYQNRYAMRRASVLGGALTLNVGAAAE